jgi:cold shock protein
MAEREFGTVKFFSAQKGFGFIRADGDPADAKDVFLPSKALADKTRTPTKDSRVSFVRIQESKGPRASGVQVIS